MLWGGTLADPLIMLFDREGRCIEVPGQSAIPPGAEVRAYPLVERHGAVWIWMGDAAAADPALVPDVFWLDDPGWTPAPDFRCTPACAAHRPDHNRETPP